MTDILRLNNVNDYARDIGAPVYHPHVSVIHYDEMGLIRHTLNRFGVYAIFMQDNFPDGIVYGAGTYDFSCGSLTAVSPGQILGKEDDGTKAQYHGWVLMFDADFIRGTELGRNLPKYHFFSYNINEALILAPKEREALDSIMENIRAELSGEAGEYTDRIVLDYIQLVLDYCSRFYSRQFRNQVRVSSDIMSRFGEVLGRYYEDGKQYASGIPSVKYCAGELNMSPGYFGDVVRDVSGENALSYIKDFIVERAKDLLVGGMSVTQVSEELGYEYPQHFTRVFKKQTGILPSRYIEMKKR